SHAGGFSGTPRSDQSCMAATNASCTTSSASCRLCGPRRRVSTEINRPASRRKMTSTVSAELVMSAIFDRFRPGAISDRKAGGALNDLLSQRRPLARFPERCRVDDPVAKRTAIGTIAARDRAWYADELGSHFIAGQPHLRIAVTAHIHEFKVRGKVR